MIELFYLNDAMQRMAAIKNQTEGQGPHPLNLKSLPSPWRSIPWTQKNIENLSLFKDWHRVEHQLYEEKLP